MIIWRALDGKVVLKQLNSLRKEADIFEALKNVQYAGSVRS